MAILTKAQILAARDREPMKIDVPEWGGEVLLAPMSAAQREKYQLDFDEVRRGAGDGKTSIRARLVSACLVDEEGKALFTAAEVVELADRSGVVLDRLFDLCLEQNAFTQKAAERVRGNSSGDRHESSHIVLPSLSGEQTSTLS